MIHQMGRQVLAELTFCDRRAVNDEALLHHLLRRAAADSGATLLSVHVHRFEPQGLSGVAILAESHLAIHTWPELGYAAVDAFTCGDHVDPRRAVQVLEEGLGAHCLTTIELNRGMQPSIAAMDRLGLDRAHPDRGPGGQPNGGSSANVPDRPGEPHKAPPPH